MNCVPRLRRLLSCPTFVLLLSLPHAWAQTPPPSRPIDIDRELQKREPQDRAQSYYYYTLAKWLEGRGELDRALAEMEKAKRYNDNSATIRVELAGILFAGQKRNAAIEECQAALRLEPGNVEAHWLLAYIYSSDRDRVTRTESLGKAVRELEKMKEAAPEDYRPYYALGGFYFELGEPQKAVEAFEKFQSLQPDTDQGYTTIAEYYQRQGNTAKAIEYLQKAAERDPESVKNLMALASMYTQAKMEKDAILIYRKILSLSGENVAVKRQLGLSLIDAAEFTEAAEVLNQVVQAVPEDAFAWTQLGRAYLGSRQYAKAIESLESALKRNPGNPEAQFYLGVSHEQSGNQPEAIRIFTGLLDQTQNPSGNYAADAKSNRAVFKQHLASSYQDLGEHEKAIAIYEELAREAPAADHQFTFMLINAYRINRQLDKALGLGRSEFEKTPNDVALGIVYARTLADAGKANQGAEILNRLVKQDPANPDLYVNLSQVYIQGKRYADAERVLRRAMDQDSDKERFKFQLATVYEHQKDFDRAESLFKEIIAENPDHANALNYIGYMLADRGVRLEEAVGYVERALQLEPNNGAYLDSMGWAMFKLDKLEEAEKYLLRAVENQKNDPVIHDHLGDLYFRTGDLQKAEDYWKRSVAIGTEAEETDKVREKLDKLRESLRQQKRRP